MQRSSDLLYLNQDVSGPSEGRLPLPSSALSLTVSNCPICGSSLGKLPDDDDCPNCGSPARTRSLAPIVSEVIAPLIERGGCRELPLLAFAMTSPEHMFLQPVFPRTKSVSLFGNYSIDHEIGVDARDLSRYDPRAFSGAFSILVWDYFTEHDLALRETYRVLAPGGVFFTLIANYRLVDGDEAPWLHKEVRSRPGYLEYIPADTTLASIKLGRSWFVEAMRRAGFDADSVHVRDEASGIDFNWFVGQRPMVDRVPEYHPSSTLHTPASPLPAPVAVMTVVPKVVAPLAKVTSTLKTPHFERTYSTPVDSAFGFSLVGLTLSLPSLPAGANGIDFAEHVIDPVTGTATDTVIGVKTGGIVYSHDLGRSWTYRPTPETGDVRLWNAVTLGNGDHLIQGIGPSSPEDAPDDPAFQATIFRFDRDWRLIDQTQPSITHWHGTRSVDQRGETIIFAEYTENGTPYRADFAERRAELEHLCRNSRVLRSTDNGATWAVAFEMPWTEIRHFHTVAADPFEPGVWWLSSGDRSDESRVWRSADDGVSWTDVTGRDLDFPIESRFMHLRQSAFRHTDVVVTPDSLIWGADDWLGEPHNLDPRASVEARSGARLFVASKELPLRPRAVAYLGNPVRSIIDIGPCYLIATQAKYAPVLPRPQIFLVSKSDPELCAEIGTIDQFSTSGSGFTHSRSSRVAKDGRFFSYRAYHDVFRNGPRLLQWDIAFQ